MHSLEEPVYSRLVVLMETMSVLVHLAKSGLGVLVFESCIHHCFGQVVCSSEELFLWSLGNFASVIARFMGLSDIAIGCLVSPSCLRLFAKL